MNIKNILLGSLTALVVTFSLITPVFAATVVTPSSLNGWEIHNYNAPTDADMGSTPTASGTKGEFVTGPGTPPAGTGSFRQDMGTNGDDAQRLWTTAYNGTPVASLSGLSYATYVTSFGSGGQASYIQLRIDRDGNGTTDDQLFFEPVYQNGTYSTLAYSSAIPNQCGGNPNCVSLTTWQTWNAQTGGWWSVVDSAGGPPLTTLASYATQYPGAKLATDAAAVRITTGFGGGAWANFDGNVDNFSINGTTFDFEGAPALVGPPTTFSQCENNGWKTFTNPTFSSKSKCLDYVKKNQHTIKGNDVVYTANSLKREADMNMSDAEKEFVGSFEYDDAAKGWYNVKVASVKVDGNLGWFAGRVVKASNPAWVNQWIFAKVEDGSPDKIWGSFTDEATARAGVAAMATPADGPFTVTKKNIQVK